MPIKYSNGFLETLAHDWSKCSINLSDPFMYDRTLRDLQKGIEDPNQLKTQIDTFRGSANTLKDSVVWSDIKHNAVLP